MSSTTGIAEQVLSLPKGGGAVKGLGEQFSPDLHTGTGTYPIPLDIPNGPNDIAPKLTLLYHTGTGHSAFGLGFSLNLPTISRSLSWCLPTYDEHDRLVLLGSGNLVAIGNGCYRLKVDDGSWRIQQHGEGFRLCDREGKYYFVGTSEQAQRYVEEAGQRKVLSWHLEAIEDALGNRVTFRYQREGNQLYLDQIDYSIYSLRFLYDTRPDPISDGRAGFLIQTRLRCRQIELHLNNSPQPLLRRWDFTYQQSEPGGHSLLHQVKLTGFDEAGQTASLPVLTLDYTRFSPRRLQRFQSEPNASPAGLSGGQRELLDWNGDGLPDVLELGNGSTRVWQNLGNCTWARPQAIATLPVPIALNQPGIAFADMEGNGTADLIMLDRPLSGYYPHLPGGGFGRPVFWSHTPSTPLSEPNARLVDLDSDGRIDLLVTGDHFFRLYYRDAVKGWQSHPQLVPRDRVPPVSLSDPHVHLADMNGDGLQDLVRVDGAGVVYWAYLGHGCWAEPRRLHPAPILPRGFDPKRLFLSDIDGDGCADLVYVDRDRICYWINQGGNQLSPMQEIKHTPPASTDQIRLADMQGNGTAGVLWSATGAASYTRDYFYLDFTGGVKPYLLHRIDNGMGLVTEIEYSVSTAEAARDKQQGRAWQTFLPFSVPVVQSVRVSDQVTQSQMQSRYSYHQGHFDSDSREFAGFGYVEAEESGDDAMPPSRNCNWYHLGIDPTAPAHPLSEVERDRLQALRGKLLRTELYGLDGSPEQALPYTRMENDWNYRVETVSNGEEIIFPYLVENRIIHLERRINPYRVERNRNTNYDDFGNVLTHEQHAEDPRDPTLNRILYTEIAFAQDPSERFISKPSRVKQWDEQNQLVATTVYYYDQQPEGQIASQGLLSRQESLVLPDALVEEVYGNNAPDWVTLGYHRQPGETGWWISQASYTRTDDATGLWGTSTNARGSTSQIFYDVHKIHPVKIIDAMGNWTEGTYDYRANKLRSLTDVNGAALINRYDPLGRLVEEIDSSIDASTPITQYRYNTEQAPIEVVTLQRTDLENATPITRRTFLNGAGQILETRLLTEAGEIVEQSLLYSGRGKLKVQALPYLTSLSGYESPNEGVAKSYCRYDALGRVIEIRNPNSTVRRNQIKPGMVDTYDEEDNATSVASHSNTPTRYRFDPTGRVQQVALNQAGRWITTRYVYNLKGNLISATDSLGNQTVFVEDLLGHQLQTSSPATGTVRMVVDASSNIVLKTDARGESVAFEFDLLNRPQRTFSPTSGEVFAAYTYHDEAGTEPPQLGQRTKGRLAQVTHPGGMEQFDYDSRGRITQKTLHLTGLPNHLLAFDYQYRIDGQLKAITYPSPCPHGARLQIRYEYDRAGRLQRIPSVVNQITYHPAGLKTRIELANQVVTTYDYDPLTLRLNYLRTTAPNQATLQEHQYHYDAIGNLLQVDSPDPQCSAHYRYDDLYRLVQATRQSGESWSYDYDDIGNLQFKSDVGHYTYGEKGWLITAGSQTFSHTPAGQMAQRQSDEYYYDALGQLRSITRNTEQIIYRYNHQGQRVQAQWITDTGQQEIWTPDSLLTIENGVFLASICAGAMLVAQMRLDSKEIAFLHSDHLDSIRLVTGILGTILRRTDYDPFGAILSETSTTEATLPQHRYTGQLWDSWATLYYYRSRYYAPHLGRFLTPDNLISAVHDPLAWNRYSYVRNNPLRFTDSSGHFWEEFGKILGVIAVVGIVTVLTILTAGALAPVLGVSVGWACGVIATSAVIGGVVGGIAANRAGGDVLLGIAVGITAGGLSAMFGMSFAAASVSLIGSGSFLATIVSGAINGAFIGAGTGLSAGYAGGQGDLENMMKRMLQGALTGALTGAVFSLGSWGLTHGWFDVKSSNFLVTGGIELIKRPAVYFAAGSVSELMRQGLYGEEVNWSRIGDAGVGSFFTISLVEQTLPLMESNASLTKMNLIPATSLATTVGNPAFVLEFWGDLQKLWSDN